MSDSFKSSDTARGVGLMPDQSTGQLIPGLTDVTAKVVNPDGTVLFDAFACSEVLALPGQYGFSILPAQRSQVGKYTWRMTSPTANILRDVDGSFLSGVESDVYGSEAVSVFVRDSVSLLGIPDVGFSLYDSSGTVLIGLGESNASGYVVLDGRSVPGFSRDPGTYIIRLVKALVSFDPSYSRTVVVGGPNDFELEGTVLTIPLPTDPGKCGVWGNVADLGLTIACAETLILNFIPKIPTMSGDYWIRGKTKTARPNKTTGQFYIELGRGSEVNVVVTELGVDGIITIPDQATGQLKLDNGNLVIV